MGRNEDWLDEWEKEEKVVPRAVPSYPGLPPFIRTKRRTLKVLIRGQRVSVQNEVVDVDHSESNMLLFFMSPHALRKLTPEKYCLYHLMWKYWGDIDRKALFKLLGLTASDVDDRQKVHNGLARAVGSRLVNLTIVVQQYLLTWKFPSVKEFSRYAHAELLYLVPIMSQVGGLLMADGPYTIEKPFKDAVTLASRLNEVVSGLFDEQIMLASTTTNEERRDWLYELKHQTTLFKNGVRGVLGSNHTTALMLQS